MKCCLKFKRIETISFQDWNEEDPLQKAMLMAKEKRYDMTALRRSYKTTSHEDFAGEKTTVSKEKKSKTMEPSSSSTIKIKVEHPLVIKHKQHLKTLITGKGHKFTARPH